MLTPSSFRWGGAGWLDYLYYFHKSGIVKQIIIFANIREHMLKEQKWAWLANLNKWSRMSGVLEYLKTFLKKMLDINISYNGSLFS